MVPGPSLYKTPCSSPLAVSIPLALFFFLFFGNASAYSINGLDVSQTEQLLLPMASVVTDDDGILSAEEAFNLAKSKQEKNESSVVSFGFSSAAHWFLVPLHNPENVSLKRLLVFEPTWLDDVQLTLFSGNSEIAVFQGGDLVPFSQRAIAHQKINFELTIPPGKSSLLVRTQTRDPYLVRMVLWERSAFYQYDAKEKLFLGVLYGVIIAMLLYNLILYVSVGERVYLAYVGYLLFFLFGHVTYNGYSYLLFWPESPEWGNWAHTVFDYLFVFSGLVFATVFLELRDKLLKVYRWVVVLAGVMALSFVCTAIVGGYDLNVDSSIWWITFYAPFVLLLGALSLRSGNRSARYFLTAAVAGFIGAFITALSVSGIIPYTFYTFHAVDIGMLMDAVLLSFALADRLRLAIQESDGIKAELLEATQSQSKELEKQVAQRTLELREANATKDKFLSIVGHDLRGPISSLKLLFHDVVRSADDFSDETLRVARQSITNTYEFVDQLFIWALSQTGHTKVSAETFDMSVLLMDIQQLYSSQAQGKQVSLNLAVTAPHWVYADKVMTHTVVRNLAANALKFTKRGGVIDFTISSENEFMRIHVTDTGVGMEQWTVKALFRLDSKPQSSLGTEKESGTGLGLILCSEFVAKNGGEIGVESQREIGSHFWFTLPKAKDLAPGV